MIRRTSVGRRVQKTRVSSKGQVTISKHVRDSLALTPGTEIEFQLGDGATRTRRRVGSDAGILKWIGHFKKIDTPSEETGSLALVSRLRGRAE